MIRATLDRTKSATWAIYGHFAEHEPPQILGTCFKTDPSGHFLTATLLCGTGVSEGEEPYPVLGKPPSRERNRPWSTPL
jgi:hypothetical protein